MTPIRPPGDLPHELLEHLAEERSAMVILTVLERLRAGPERVPAELRQHLGRAWADHPDVAVRRALVSAGSTFKARPHVAGEATDVSAEVVALPASALARDDIDRLRVALWSGDSDHLVELATHVPLDRRAPAREALLGALEIPNAALRRAIVEAIGRIGSHADGPRLLDAARRYRALESTVAASLRELNARALAERLAELYRRRLKWADDDAVDDYCAIAGPEQVMHLLGALETRYYPSARAGAARAIARRKAHEVVFALRTSGLTDTQESSRLAALGALHDLTGTSPSADELAGHALLYRPTEELPEAIERAREAGSAALAGIRRTLARGSWKRRRAACDVLATLPASAAEEATQVLIDVLSDPDEDVRLAAMEALAQRGWEARTAREKTLQALAGRRAKDLLQHPNDLDPATLIGALRLGGHVFRSEVIEVLARVPGFAPTPDQEGALGAARLDVERALAARGGLEAVLRAVDHTWQAVPHRARFVRGLATVGVDGLAAELETHEWGWRAREAACQAMVRPTRPPDDELEPAIHALQRQLGEEDDDVRKTAFQGLAWIGTRAAAEAVATGFQSPFQEDRDLVAAALAAFAEDGLEVIDRLMHEGWWESRQGAALALGHWREATRAAVDRLIVLAVDAEYRVSQAAREGLARHGLIPSRAAIVDAIGMAQSLTIEGLEPWLLLQLQHASPEIALRLDQLVEETPPDLLPQRIGLIATFRVEHLALWLEDAAHGRITRHIGVRLAAADALRALTRHACPVCRGERSVRCPGCNGAGDAPCPTCAGRGTVLVACPDPDCTARLATRPIDSKRCPTCRGRGEVPRPCLCQASATSEIRRVVDSSDTPSAERRGRVACEVCAGAGRLACQACDGSGEARATADPGNAER
ncbi:MAG: HEAT repeat domain-containing protein [Myxococcota bacterium]